MRVKKDGEAIQKVGIALAQLQCHFFITPGADTIFVESSGQLQKIEDRDVFHVIEKFSIDLLAISPNTLIQEFAAKYGFESKSTVNTPLFQQEWRRIVNEYSKAIHNAKELAEKYKVHVAILDTKAEFDSEEILLKTLKENIYFISTQDVDVTTAQTDHLIKCMKLRDKLQVKDANAKRFEKADQTAIELTEQINEVKQAFREANQGKEPPLRKIAEILSERQVVSPNGSTKWFAQTVKRILDRTHIER